ncbi:MAG: YbjN domain-containing protein [Actinomycetota bacterium]
MRAPSTDAELDALESAIDAWLGDQLAENPVVVAVERGEPGRRRWYVRVHGEDKDVYSIWFTLGQRTLAFETYFMPSPEENREACFAHLLGRNQALFGLAFSIGEEEAVFLSGQLPNHAVDQDELDRVLGTIYATVEQCFLAAVRLGFASRIPSSTT